ncbi:MAG: phosphoenolpyruvate carboxykinase (ATP) [Desulfobulbaceae bacterium]|nr:phosphoenolpyruvate carboxykinase (ATP) [Desulfobulbaceae bacterium]
MATTGLYEQDLQQSSPLRLTALLPLARNCREIAAPQELYDLSLNMGTVIPLTRPMQNPQEFGFRPGTRQLVWNHAKSVGRTAKARRFWHEADAEGKKKLATLAREAALKLQATGTITCRAYAGLDQEFCVGLRFLGNQHYPITALSFLLNFQGFLTTAQHDFFSQSRPIPEPDMLLVYDPDWQHPEHPEGLVIIDRAAKAIFVLGLPYFGEVKKGLLTLIWQTAIHERVPGTDIRRFLPIHGSICVINGKTVVIIALSGSGKSSLSRHAETIAHDDAFLVSMVTGRVIVLEPTFFNKTDGDAIGDETTERGLIFYNMGVAEVDGRIEVVPRDRLVANGRVIQARPANAVNGYNRVDIVSLVMKDDTLPPISLINDPALFVAFGASLMTKRSLAEALKSVAEQFTLVIEPFAQPFRSWRLNTECRMFQLFLELFQPVTVLLNTGDFMGQDIKLELSRDRLLPALTKEELEFTPWQIIPKEMVSLPRAGSLGPEYDQHFAPQPSDPTYVARFVERMQARIDFLSKIRDQNHLHADFVDPLLQVRIALDEFLKRDPIAGDFSWSKEELERLGKGNIGPVLPI